jgi:diguanylate cyclase (GGDEF)-like protein
MPSPTAASIEIPSIALHRNADAHLHAQLQEIIAARQLTALLQPIVRIADGEIIGHEGLIRGPQHSALHMPQPLFEAAYASGQHIQLEDLCREMVLQRFVELQLTGKLFLNVSLTCFMRHHEADAPPQAQQQEAMTDKLLARTFLQCVDIDPRQVVIELMENEPVNDYALMSQALLRYRRMGFQIAIDDLGAGFASLRLWFELRPEYIKIDKHFIHDFNNDPLKLQFVRSMQELAKKSNSLVIAEGVETEAELRALRDIGIGCSQGYLLGRPCTAPAPLLPAAVAKICQSHRHVARHPTHSGSNDRVGKLLQIVNAISPKINNNDVYDLFLKQPKLLIIPVVEHDVPLGLLSRHRLIEHFSRPYSRELSGRKSCTMLMDAHPIIVDQESCLQDVSFTLAQAQAHHLTNGFIITASGKYAGMGTGHDLMREMTQRQMTAARYANALTQLPGNVPINEKIDLLLGNGTVFWACYCDLDHFKPYNDVYGYRKGDEVIQLTGAILNEQCDPRRDFVGHIGGDDFMILFQSEDWEQRCHAILDHFGRDILNAHSVEDRTLGGYASEDRQGNATFFSLISLSLGVVKVEPQHYHSHHQIATAAAESKKQAKKMPGNSLFIERRETPS